MREDSTVSSSASPDSSESKSSSSDCPQRRPLASTTTTRRCRCVHLDKDWCPGTKKLREVARQVAYENDCRKFSTKICKQILKQMEGMRFFQSIKSKTSENDSEKSDCTSQTDSDSHEENDSEGDYGFGCYNKDGEVDADDIYDVEEVRRKELHDAIRPFYMGERFMIQTKAHCRDVYFKHPNHSGTQAFVRASQQLVIRLGISRSYDERTYQKMMKLLYDSKFFVGKAPECVEANEEDCGRIFQARYEFDRRAIKKIMLRNRVAKQIPGTVWIKGSCCAKKDPRKKIWFTQFLDRLPEASITPVLLVIFFFGFGFSIYFAIWYLFKIVLTIIYVILGVSISFLLGRHEDEEEAIKEAVGEIFENTVERKLSNFW